MTNRIAQMTIAELIKQRTLAKPEKRRHNRIFLCLPMEYSFPESSCPRFAHTVDICEDGLLMYVLGKLEIGQDLRVKVYYDSASGIDCIEALGEVIRVDR